jgi:hypothetical protein
MKSSFLRAVLFVVLALAPAGAATVPADTQTDAEVAAHAAVLDLAGAFTNDGFKLRDANYTGTLQTGDSKVIEVNLYAGNQYWFSVATADPKTKVSIDLYDESGKLLATNPYSDVHRAAAGYSPDASGPYYVRIANPGAAATYCVIYSYK